MLVFFSRSLLKIPQKEVSWRVRLQSWWGVGEELTITMFLKSPKGLHKHVDPPNRWNGDHLCCGWDSHQDSLRFFMSSVCLSPVCIINIFDKNGKGLNSPTISFRLAHRGSSHFDYSGAFLPTPQTYLLPPHFWFGLRFPTWVMWIKPHLIQE